MWPRLPGGRIGAIADTSLGSEVTDRVVAKRFRQADAKGGGVLNGGARPCGDRCQTTVRGVKISGGDEAIACGLLSEVLLRAAGVCGPVRLPSGAVLELLDVAQAVVDIAGGGAGQVGNRAIPALRNLRRDPHRAEDITTGMRLISAAMALPFTMICACSVNCPDGNRSLRSM